MSTIKTALIAAIVALLVGAGGGAIAATQINGHAIARHSIPANRLTPKAVKAFTSRSAGAQSPRSLAATVNSTIVYETNTVDLATLSLPADVVASCPAGDVAISGGYELSSFTTRIVLDSNIFTADRGGWQVTVDSYGADNDGNPHTITVYVTCEPTA